MINNHTKEQMIMNKSRLKSDPNIQEFIDIFDAKIENSN